MTRKNTPPEEVSPAVVDGYLRLAASVVSHAAYDAIRGDQDAAAWLVSDMAEMFCKVIGLDHRRVSIYANNWNQNAAKPVKVTWKIGLDKVEYYGLETAPV
jgi:hypothetical protein